MKRLFVAIVALCMVSVLCPGTVGAEEKQQLKTQIVRINGLAGVEPLNLFIEPGTVVVWLNQYKISPVEVVFPDKKVTMACQSPVNFSIAADGTYVSNSIQFGGVASLCFIEPGTFKYVIARARNVQEVPGTANPFRFEGNIVVKAK